MAAELDEELEQVTRESFARMIGAIRVTPPDEVPDATVARPAVVDVDDRRRRTRSRAVVVAAAGIAAVAAAATAVVLLPGDDSDRVENAPASSDDTVPGTTVETTPSTTPTTVDTTDDTTDPGATDTGDPPDETWPASGEVRGAELRDRLDQATSDVPLDRLTDVVQLEATNGPAALQVADDGNEIAVQLVAPWVIGFGSGIEGTPRQLQTHWMVSAIDAQFIVWGIVPSDIREVTVYTSEGDPVSVGTVPVGPPEMASAAFAVVLPERGLIEGMSGQLADGTVSLAGTKLDESLTQFRRHSPLNLEWTGFVPVVQH